MSALLWILLGLLAKLLAMLIDRVEQSVRLSEQERKRLCILLYRCELIRDYAWRFGCTANEGERLDRG